MHSARFQQRQERLTEKFNVALRERNEAEMVRTRFALLGYSYSDDDGGSGSALATISAAAATLGSAYITSQRQPNVVMVPQTTRPAYGAAAGVSSSSLITFALIAVVGVFAFIFFAK